MPREIGLSARGQKRIEFQRRRDRDCAGGVGKLAWRIEENGVRYVLFALTLMLASQASAQDAPNVSGFRLGMSVEEARSIAPNLFRRNVATRPLFNVTEHSHSFGRVAFPLSLVFVDGALDYAGGDSTLFLPNSEICLSRHQSLVEALESMVGPLSDEGPAGSGVSDLAPFRTSGGSNIRRYSTGETVSAIATASAPLAVDVRTLSSHQRDGLWQCSTTYSVSAGVPIPPDLPLSTIENWQWVAMPTGADFARYYPARAVDVKRPGDVTLICNVATDGALACNVGIENPVGWEFGEAALLLSRSFRMAPQTADGTPTAGATIRTTIRFRMTH
jgi:TonB family protein